MVYRIKITQEIFNLIASKKYYREILIFKDEYQKIKYNDVIEYYVDENTSFQFNIYKIVYTLPDNLYDENYEITHLNDEEIKNKIHQIKDQNKEDVEKYGIIHLYLDYKSDRKREHYHLKNYKSIILYLEKYKKHLAICKNINDEVYNKKVIIQDHDKCKITIDKELINPHFLYPFILEGELLTYILKVPFNLLNKIMNYTILIVEENNTYEYVSSKYFYENPNKKYYKGIHKCVRRSIVYNI